jgi:hypothetical protein
VNPYTLEGQTFRGKTVPHQIFFSSGFILDHPIEVLDAFQNRPQTADTGFPAFAKDGSRIM